MKRLSRISKRQTPKQVRGDRSHIMDDRFHIMDDKSHVMHDKNQVMLNLFQHLFCVLSLILIASCSLKYSETVNSEDRVPEFVFEDTKLVRYEDKQPVLEVSAATLEQYKDSNETYGKDIAFISYDDEGKAETEGSCGIIFADTQKKVYELYDGINLYNDPEKMRL